MIELPRFRHIPAGAPPARFPRREAEWLILELNLDHVRAAVLPEIIQRHLGTSGSVDYQVEVATRTTPPSLIYQSDPDQSRRVGDRVDASTGLLELQWDRIARRPGPGGLREVRHPGPDWGRWQISVRHRAGSLEAVVERARQRNLAVVAGVLLLMVAAVAALVRYTRRAQKLAELQMDFVTGVSHELRTPLTVICTAAYNLRRRVAHNPDQVERYGALIQQEGERLTTLVEQVLQFASGNAGRVVRDREPLSVETVIEKSLQSSKCVLEQSHCTIEKRIDRDLPPVLGDPTALQHAFQNLISNAAKYGAEGGRWIGISALKSNHDEQQPLVEIRVSDRGPGIPRDEQAQVFDPFFRGKKALQDQIHGTGLGLSLVKGIVEAHGGTISVVSEPAKGAEFIVRIPAMAHERQNEFTHSAGRG